MNNPELAKEYPPLNIVFKKTEEYLVTLVNSSSNYINPYTFAKKLDISDTLSISLLFLLANFSDKEIIYLEYVYTCPQGHYHYLNENELENFYCDECDEHYNVKLELMKGIHNPPINFRLSKTLLDEIKNSFKSENKLKGAPTQFRLYDLANNLSEQALIMIKDSNENNEKTAAAIFTFRDEYIAFHTND
ncbi:hypothetical protein [Exiguobacterium sp. s142]|uniref:hypothetical protein n=1 Tax=Exiguobacterium sp. s142 TaxID=2751222 RepID=UPI001BE5D057|nr:hypothetical protein [Exiguobacterium sp. s142]